MPQAITQWHYDRVHDCFRNRGAAFVGDWPGYYGDYIAEDSPVRDDFALALYPTGPSGRTRVYGGSHTFALTPVGAAKPEALALLRFLTAPAQQELEARHGTVPVRTSVMQAIRTGAQPVAFERLHLLEQAVESVVIPPKLARHPEIEEILWRTVQAAMTGALEVDAALEQMTWQIGAIVDAAKLQDGRLSTTEQDAATTRVLAGKVIFLTGGATGIGREKCAVALTPAPGRDGRHCRHNLEGAQETLALLKGPAGHAVPCDLGSAQSVEPRWQPRWSAAVALTQSTTTPALAVPPSLCMRRLKPSGTAFSPSTSRVCSTHTRRYCSP